MELSIRSKFMSEEVLEKRRRMIETEKLHINDKITEEVFQRLYSKYGKGLDEKDFAYSFLDINDINYSRLKRGKNSETVILSYEYISNEEFKAIREKLIETYELENGEKITYNQLLEMYEQFSGRLSMQIFIEEILGMSVKDLTKLKTGIIKGKPVNFKAEPGQYSAFHKKTEKIPMYALNPEYIYKMRKRLVLEAGLRIGDDISYSQIQELSKQYCPEISERLFAQKMLGISAEQYDALKKTNSENPVNGFVFKDTDIDNKYIDSIRKKMIRKHKLESGQLLQYEEFEKLYEEYGGVLSKKSFAILVLEMSNESYSHFKSKTYKSVTILGSRQGTDLDILREKIIKENGFHCGDFIKYKKFKRVHQKYAPNIPEVVFAKEILGIALSSFERMKYYDRHVGIHLKLPSSDEMAKIQQRILLETGIHINDRLNYAEIERLHGLYGGILPIRIFAMQVMCLSSASFSQIKNNKNAEAFAFFNLEIPESEIEEIKQRVILECNLQKTRRLSLEEINNLYNTYGGIMSFSMFAREILGIGRGSINSLKCKEFDTTMACVRSKFNEEEIQELKKYLADGLPDTKIATKMGVTTSFLRTNMQKLIALGELTDSSRLYEKVKRLSDQEKSPEEIVEIINREKFSEKVVDVRLQVKSPEEILEEVGISEEDVRKMLERYEKEQEGEGKGKISAREQKRKKEIEKKAKRTLHKYEFDDESIKIVREYIAECKKSFEEGSFLRRDLEFLKECMIFIQCNYKEIQLFCRICIKFNAYKAASYFITENLDNEDILPEEKINLMELRTSIEYAIRKEEALRMLQSGNEDTDQIAKKTRILEVEVIDLKRKLCESRIGTTGGENSQEER